jgi:hypothetical protein
MLEWRPGERLRHICFVSESERAATTMRRQKGPSFDATVARPRMNSISGFRDTQQRVENIRASDGLRYSSPWPWVRAIVMSMMLWALIGWYFWSLFH